MLESICRNVTIAKKDDSTTTKATKTVMFEDVQDDNFLSVLMKTNIKGPNPNLAKGPRDEILL
jgi:hypothetical protein